MSEFDDIRPFHDNEVPEVVARVMDNPDFSRAASKLIMPSLLKDSAVGRMLTGALFRLRTRNLTSVEACQLFIADYLARLIEETIEDLTVSGLDRLSRDRCYLYMSNHRDIVMDSSLLNYLIHQAGHETSRMAVGDNLLTNDLAADLMRLNKSFVVERSVSGAKATLNALSRTSAYIRHSLEEGVSIWIAQREGRAKDGWDRTDPALLKMLALAYKDSSEPLDAMLAACDVVPVSISYELDPCALRKAHELSVIAAEGGYAKSEEEDLQSIITGIVGFKGRVHVHFGEPLAGHHDSPEALAADLDRAIVGGLKVFPTHVQAAEALGDAPVETATAPVNDRVMNCFAQQQSLCPAAEREYFLLQYANTIRNRKDLDVAAG